MIPIKAWIAKRVVADLGLEDDIVIEMIYSLLEQEESPDPRKMQIALTGFLEKKTAKFMEDLWKLLLSAMEGVGGVPREFIEEKRAQMEKQRVRFCCAISWNRCNGGTLMAIFELG